MGVLEILDGCPGDIRWMSWRNLMVVLRYLYGVLEISNVCLGHIFSFCS